jgi:DNA polymerase-3 subunit epsilon
MISLDKPLAIFDLETTGVDLVNDRIVQLSVIKVVDWKESDRLTLLINPGIPIPAAATAVHGITDRDVIVEPKFFQVAEQVRDFFKGCDLAGYNIMRFDVPMLVQEFERCRIAWPEDGVRYLDAQSIFFKMEPRTLSAAVKFYCNRDHEEAHSAEADAEATLDVLREQVNRYRELGSSIDEASAFLGLKDLADPTGKLIRNDQGELLFNFGKNKGLKVADFPDYVNWILESDFPAIVKAVLRKAIAERS